MEQGAAGAVVRGYGALVLVLLTVVAGGVAQARPVGVGERPARARVLSVAVGRARAMSPRRVTLGAVDGAGVLRGAMQDALGEAAARRTGWLTQGPGGGGSVVLNAHVRHLEVRRDAAGMLASCEVAVVAVDSSGAVRATVETRTVVRGDALREASVLEREALRGAWDVVLRRLESAQW